MCLLVQELRLQINSSLLPKYRISKRTPSLRPINLNLSNFPSYVSSNTSLSSLTQSLKLFSSTGPKATPDSLSDSPGVPAYRPSVRGTTRPYSGDCPSFPPIHVSSLLNSFVHGHMCLSFLCPGTLLSPTFSVCTVPLCTCLTVL